MYNKEVYFPEKGKEKSFRLPGRKNLETNNHFIMRKREERAKGTFLIQYIPLVAKRGLNSGGGSDAVVSFRMAKRTTEERPSLRRKGESRKEALCAYAEKKNADAAARGKKVPE